MSSYPSESKSPYHFSDHEQWLIDEMIIHYEEAKNDMERKKAELECYKLYKMLGFKDEYIDCLKDFDLIDLAEEMEHFCKVYNKAPHTHEKRLAA